MCPGPGLMPAFTPKPRHCQAPVLHRTSSEILYLISTSRPARLPKALCLFVTPRMHVTTSYPLRPPRQSRGLIAPPAIRCPFISSVTNSRHPSYTNHTSHPPRTASNTASAGDRCVGRYLPRKALRLPASILVSLLDIPAFVRADPWTKQAWCDVASTLGY